MEPLQRAIGTAGGVSALATLLGVSGSAPHMWLTREKVPAEHCPAIERETRRIAIEKDDASLVVTCEELRPDVAWGVLREQAAPAEPATTEG